MFFLKEVRCPWMRTEFKLSSFHTFSSFRLVGEDPNSGACRTESDCFVTNSFLEYCLFPPNERCYRVYFNYWPHSLGLNYRYCFHLLLQDVMCSSRIWKRGLHPIPLYATMSLFCWMKFIWHSISDLWMLPMTMQELGCAAVLGDIMTIVILHIVFYSRNTNEQKLCGNGKWRSRA